MKEERSTKRKNDNDNGPGEKKIKQNPLSLDKTTNKITDLYDANGEPNFYFFKYQVNKKNYISIIPNGVTPEPNGKAGFYPNLVFFGTIIPTYINITGDGDRNEAPESTIKTPRGMNKHKFAIKEFNDYSKSKEIWSKKGMNFQEESTNIFNALDKYGEDLTNFLLKDPLIVKEIEEKALKTSKCKNMHEFEQLHPEVQKSHIQCATHELTNSTIAKTTKKEGHRYYEIKSYIYKAFTDDTKNKYWGALKDHLETNGVDQDDSRFCFIFDEKNNPRYYNRISVYKPDPKNKDKLIPYKSDNIDYFNPSNMARFFKNHNTDFDPLKMDIFGYQPEKGSVLGVKFTINFSDPGAGGHRSVQVRLHDNKVVIIHEMKKEESETENCFSYMCSEEDPENEDDHSEHSQLANDFNQN